MNCTQARELLPLLLYGDLSAEMRVALDEHIRCVRRRDFSTLCATRLRHRILLAVQTALAARGVF